VVMCGAISGFHSLIASGTTPKMIAKESHIRPIGYGAMVLEGFVAITALIAACALEPGDYFAINVAQDRPDQIAAYTRFVDGSPAQFGMDLAPRELATLESGTEEKLAGRTGGAVTLAVGMAKVFASVPGMRHLMAYWYHFVIMFEALFILTLLETGTRVARFVFQETTMLFTGPKAVGTKPNWIMNVGMSLAVCFGWGYLLYMGNLNTLWRMLGIANQLLASIALAVGTTYLLLHAPKRRYALCTGIPFVVVLSTVLTAGVISVRGWWQEIAAAPADQTFLLKLVCVLSGIMLALTVVIAVDAIRRWVGILREPALPAARVVVVTNE